MNDVINIHIPLAEERFLSLVPHPNRTRNSIDGHKIPERKAFFAVIDHLSVRDQEKKIGVLNIMGKRRTKLGGLNNPRCS